MEFINRIIYSNRLEPYIDKGIIKVLTGQRRVGKSCVLIQIMKKIQHENPNANIIYINKESDEFRNIQTNIDLSNFVA